jgi:hypothetical protein
MSSTSNLNKANVARLPQSSMLKRYKRSSELVDKHIMGSGPPGPRQTGNTKDGDCSKNYVDDLDKYMKRLTKEKIINDARADVKDHVGL